MATTTALAMCLGHLKVEPVELAWLIEERVERVSRWAEGGEATPRWLELLAQTWRDHPALLAIAREAAASRLTEVSAEDLAFAAVA